MDAKISVIIPFYKTPMIKLKCCIESFLGQSFENFELLLVNDGNSPEYENVCEAYAENDKRVRVITQKNAGVSAARNNGMKNAKGEYIVFCDSDDYVDGNFLEMMYQNMPGYDLVICGVCEQYYPSNDTSVDMKVFCSSPTQYNWLQYVNFTPNKIFRKAIIDEHRIEFQPDVCLGEDALFVHDYLNHCRHVRCIMEAMYHYVWNEKSAVHTYNARYWRWEEKVITCQYEMFHRYPLSRNEQEFMQKWLYIKLKSCLYYYLSNEADQRKKKKYIKKIMDNRYFGQIFDGFYANRHYGIRDKAVLLTWKIFGVSGIKMSYWYSAHRRPFIEGHL